MSHNKSDTICFATAKSAIPSSRRDRRMTEERPRAQKESGLGVGMKERARSLFLFLDEVTAPYSERTVRCARTAAGARKKENPCTKSVRVIRASIFPL